MNPRGNNPRGGWDFGGPAKNPLKKTKNNSRVKINFPSRPAKEYHAPLMAEAPYPQPGQVKYLTDEKQRPRIQA
jgi:hypothetical protein